MRFIGGVLILLFAAIANATIAPPAYHLIELGSLGADGGEALAINSAGQLAGFNRTTPSDPNGRHAFRWTNGAMQDVGTLGGMESFAYGINDAGTVVGYSLTSGNDSAFFWDGQIHGLPSFGLVSYAFAINSSGVIAGRADNAQGSQPVVWTNAGIQQLPTLGGATGYAIAINGNGTVAGSSHNASGSLRPTRWSNGIPLDLGVAGDGDATSINGSGQIVGYSLSDPSGTHNRAFFWDGTPHVLNDTIGALETFALGMNDAGHIVGEFDEEGGSGGPNGGFLYYQGQMYDLSTLVDSSGSGWTILQARAINGADQIAAFAESGGIVHPVLLNPIPEPSGALWVGIAILLWLERRSRSINHFSNGSTKSAGPASQPRRTKSIHLLSNHRHPHLAH